MRNSSPPCERGEGRKAAGGFRPPSQAFPLPGGRWPVGPDEGGSRWAHTSPAGRCPQRPVDNGCTPVVPLIRHGLRPCHLLPCGAKALADLSGALKCRWRSPHPSRLRRATFPQGKAIYILKYSNMIQHFVLKKRPVIPLPVPSYTVGYRGSRRIRRADAWRAKDVDWDGLCAGGWPWD